MRWMIAGLAFAACLVLAIYTAVVRGDNTRRRLRLLDGEEYLNTLAVALDTEAKRSVERVNLDSMLESWAGFRGLEVEDRK
ncbi:MAG: hypothetical protein AAF196_04425 [Planctomycetota bacterium]